MMPAVTITARGEERLRSGHPWIYRSDVTAVEATAGDIVRVLGLRGRPMGSALFSDRSQIALRLLTDGKALFLQTRQGHVFDVLIDPFQPLIADGLPLRRVHARKGRRETGHRVKAKG